MFDAPHQCQVCAHALGQGTCRAFPDGIPVSISTLEHDHREAYPGDQGVRFEPDPARPEGVAEILRFYDVTGSTGAIAPELRAPDA